MFTLPHISISIQTQMPVHRIKPSQHAMPDLDTVRNGIRALKTSFTAINQPTESFDDELIELLRESVD